MFCLYVLFKVFTLLFLLIISFFFSFLLSFHWYERVGMDVLQVMRALGEALNFTPEFFNPGPDLWGSLLPNGTFSGMVGRYYRRHRKRECGQLHHESQVVTKRPACNSNWCWYNFFFAQGIARISKKYLKPKKIYCISFNFNFAMLYW